MTTDRAGIVERLKNVLADGSAVRLAVLFGSYARNAAQAASDLDVGIIPLDPNLAFTEELDLSVRLERACGIPVDLVRLDRASTLLRWEAARTSIALAANPATEFSRFVTAAALEHADLMTTLGPAAERFRRGLASARGSYRVAESSPR